jgi:hypothetical protein
LAENARWTRENTASCAQLQNGVEATRHHLKEFQHKVGALDLDDDDRDPANRPAKLLPPGGREGAPDGAALCATGAAPQWPGCGTTLVRHATSALCPPPLITCGILFPFHNRGQAMRLGRLQWHPGDKRGGTANPAAPIEKGTLPAPLLIQ